MTSYSTENEKILLATFESALMHLQKANKRLTIITVTALVLMGLIVYKSQETLFRHI